MPLASLCSAVKNKFKLSINWSLSPQRLRDAVVLYECFIQLNSLLGRSSFCKRWSKTPSWDLLRFHSRQAKIRRSFSSRRKRPRGSAYSTDSRHFAKHCPGQARHAYYQKERACLLLSSPMRSQLGRYRADRTVTRDAFDAFGERQNR